MKALNTAAKNALRNASLAVLPLLLLVPARSFGEELVPNGYPADRYAPIWKKSPFTLSSVTSEAVGTFADKLILTGVLKIGDTSYVSIMDKDTKQRMLVSNNPDENDQHITLVSLQPNDDLSKVAVILKKDSEISSPLRYDLQLLKTMAASAPPPPQVQQPPNTAQVNPQPGNPFQGGRNGMPPPYTPIPPTARVIHRPRMIQTPTPAPANAAPAPAPAN